MVPRLISATTSIVDVISNFFVQKECVWFFVLFIADSMLNDNILRQGNCTDSVAIKRCNNANLVDTLIQMKIQTDIFVILVCC